MKFTEDQVKESVATGRLVMDRDDYLRFLRIGWIKTTLSATSLILVVLVAWASDRISLFTLTFSTVAIVAAALSAFVAITALKLRSLRLIRIPTRFSKSEAREILVKFARYFRWKVLNNRKTLIILRTRLSERTTGFRSERITIFLTADAIWAASICDPEHPLMFRSLINAQENLALLRQVLSGTRKIEQ